MVVSENNRMNKQLSEPKLALYQRRRFGSSKFPNRACSWTRLTLAQLEACGNFVTCVEDRKHSKLCTHGRCIRSFDSRWRNPKCFIVWHEGCLTFATYRVCHPFGDNVKTCLQYAPLAIILRRLRCLSRSQRPARCHVAIPFHIFRIHYSLFNIQCSMFNVQYSILMLNVHEIFTHDGSLSVTVNFSDLSMPLLLSRKTSRAFFDLEF